MPKQKGPAPRRGAKVANRKRRGELALERALKARTAPRDPTGAALEVLALNLAHVLDAAVAADDRYAVAQLTPRMIDLLERLRLTPNTQPMTDGLGDLLNSLSGPPV
ncbi:hypothetical protein [Catenulispora pinisilvae]|uniref:hypothetical protein n=1 Tax=Catenulispora pinisilvae TaxID=2705253 RepID=UPI001891437C|nr:hypothetical protein [Catenulispora pinisilvae]